MTPNNLSQLELLALQPDSVKQALLDNLSDDEILDLMHDVTVVGRPKQIVPDGDWSTLLVLPGRGFGKTWMGSHWVNLMAKEYPGCKIGLIGETVADVRDTMIQGESGIVTLAHPKHMPVYTPSKRRIDWPNGSSALTFSGEEPKQLRGPQFHFSLVDELAKMRYQSEVWDMLSYCMRLGEHPRVLITTTPRPTTLIKELYKDPDVVVIEGSTFENRALPKRFLDQLRKKHDGTRLGQQELYGKILEDNPNAMFMYDDINENRVEKAPTNMNRVVIAVDPAVTSNENSDETGITICGAIGMDQGYVLGDVSIKASPNEWAKAAVAAYYDYGADCMVGEVNNGGDMIEALIRNVDPLVNYHSVRATRGKAIRAEPIAALYEQGRIHHVGAFEILEDQMISFDPSLGNNQKSPDRMDSLVWALTELFGQELNEVRITIF